MRKIAYTAVTSIMFCLTNSVMAAGMPVSWELNLGGTKDNTSVGNQWTKTNATGQTIKARAYYANQSSGNPTGTLGKSIVNQYSGGLAVCTTGETCSSAPEHALDNHLKQDYLLLEFDDIYAMSQFTIGWNAYQDYNANRTNYDSDVQMWTADKTVAAGLDLSTACISGCAKTLDSLGFKSSNTKINNDVVDNKATAITGLTNSRYLLVSGALASGNNDYFKISSIGVTKTVDEPGSLAMLAAGMLGLLGVRRARKQR